MNESNQSSSADFNDFPEVGSHPQLNEQQKRDDRKQFQNTLFPNDSVTTCSGFINEIRSHVKDGDTLYFVRMGLIQGSRKIEAGWEGDITNCDLLVGSTLRKWAEAMLPFKSAYAGIRVNCVIRNLKFTAGLYEGKPVLDSRGVLECITFGHLDS
jgi:hypothetical protein